MLFRLVLMAFLANSCAMANELVVRTLETTASPLQAYRALSEDWIYLQWSEAQTAAFGVAPDAPWRVTFADGSLDEGILKVLEPGVTLEFTMFQGDLTTNVHFEFEKSEFGTTIHLKHEIYGENEPAKEVAANVSSMWDGTLMRLKGYLDSRPVSYLTRPRGENKYPGLLLLHDRFGLSKTVRDMADSLAVRGYVVLAIDMFKGDRTSDVAQARRFEELVQEPEALASIGAGWRALLADSSVNRKRIGLLGIGYGGDMVMRTLASEPSLKAGVAWYPAVIPADTLLTRIAAPLLILHASPDGTVPSPQTEMMSQALVQQGVRAEMLLITGDHGFAEPANGAAYSGTATAEAMRNTLSFLDRRLKL